MIKGNAQGLENKNITKIHQEEFLNEDSSIVVTRTIGEIENSDAFNIETKIDIKLDRHDFDSDEEFEIALSNAIDTIKAPKLSRAYIGKTRTNTVKFTNYSGVQVKMRYKYGKHRAWDTGQYVDYLG